MKQTTTLTSYLLLLCIGIFWGSQFMFNHIALTSMTATTVSVWRSITGALTLIILAPLVPLKGEAVTVKTSAVSIWGRYVAIALLEAVIPFFTIAWGQKEVPSSVAAVLIGTVPLFTAFIASAIVKLERFTWATLVSVSVGFLGLLILLYPSLRHANFNHLIAELAILAGGLSFAASLVVMKSMPPSVPPVKMSRNVLIIAMVMLVVYALIFHPSAFIQFDMASLWAATALGVLCSGITYLLYVLLIKQSDATFASMSNYLVPIFGAFFGVVLLNDHLAINMILALIVVLLALVLHKLPQLNRSLIKQGDTS